MGKPLSSKSSQNPSSSSNSRKSLHINMNHTKKKNKLKRLRQKHKKSIQKLFDSLRNDSCERCFIPLNQSVVSVPDVQKAKCNESITPNQTVICLDDTVSPRQSLKRKASLSQESLHENRNKIIVITDNESSKINVETPKKTSQVLHCSTPIVNHDVNNMTLNMSAVLNNNTICNQNEEIIKCHKEIEVLTQEINQDSFITIDLTTETLDRTKQTVETTVIDLDKETNDCLFVNSESSLSMSGDSNITVLSRSEVNRNNKKMKQVTAAVTKLLNSGDKEKFIEMIAQNLFKGCNVQMTSSVKTASKVSLDTAEDTFIKEVILGKVQSRNSIGSNIYNPEKEIKAKSGLRMVVVDGSNVAMEHGQHKVFSVKGLKICIEYFVKRGHIVKAFVPRFRCKFGKSSDPKMLDALERQGLVIYTPSREVQGKFITPYDDRYIVQCAAEFDGVIVSGDNYRDLLQENPRWRFIIENRLLPFTWVNDMIMFPKDPLGRYGPPLEVFLKHSSNS